MQRRLHFCEPQINKTFKNALVVAILGVQKIQATLELSKKPLCSSNERLYGVLGLEAWVTLQLSSVGSEIGPRLLRFPLQPWISLVSRNCGSRSLKLVHISRTPSFRAKHGLGPRSTSQSCRAWPDKIRVSYCLSCQIRFASNLAETAVHRGTSRRLRDIVWSEPCQWPVSVPSSSMRLAMLRC